MLLGLKVSGSAGVSWELSLGEETVKDQGSATYHFKTTLYGTSTNIS
jgi:hypothetical protein